VHLGRPVELTRQNSRFWLSATSRTIIACGVPNGGTRAQATPAAVAVRSRVPRISGDVRAPLPAAMPAGSGRARKARLICSGAAGRLNCLMGVQLGFMGVQLGGKGSSGLVRGDCGCGAGTSGQQREAVTMPAR